MQMITHNTQCNIMAASLIETGQIVESLPEYPDTPKLIKRCGRTDYATTPSFKLPALMTKRLRECFTCQTQLKPTIQQMNIFNLW